MKTTDRSRAGTGAGTRRRGLAPALAALLLCSVTGCVPGYNSVLFTTQSNAGLDLDTEPPTTKFDVSRDEGVIAPVFEGGQTIPVVASFSARGGALRDFFFGADSVFATGDAAYLMAFMYGEDGVCSDDDLAAKKNGAPDLSRPPTGLPLGQAYLAAGDVKPVSFGTDTMFGVRIAWSAQTSLLPNSVKAGFNRKELAWAPVTMESGTGETGTRVRANAPSLLATVTSGVDAGASDAQSMRHLQYFATGSAADRLACQPEVRRAMLARVDPSAFARAVSVLETLRREADALESAGDALIAGADEALLARYAELMQQMGMLRDAPAGAIDERKRALQYAMTIQDETEDGLEDLRVVVRRMKSLAP